MVIFMLPPAGIVFMYLLGAMTIIVGMLLAWAWGTLTMKIALSVRNDALYNQRLLELRKSAASVPPPERARWGKTQYYEGIFLDTRVTIVYLALGLFFIYMMVGVIRPRSFF